MGACPSIFTQKIYSDKFVDYCSNGDLTNAKKYFDENPNIDIHAKDEYAFCYSCCSGRLEVAQWLWSLNQNIDIHAENDYAFRLSCQNGCLEVVKWLCTLCDYYYLEHNDKKMIKWKILTKEEIEEKKFNKKLDEFVSPKITIDPNTKINL